MMASLRGVSGILALIAMTFSVGAGLWTATCAPMEPGPQSAIAAPVSGDAPVPDCSPSHRDEPGGDEDGAGCPFASIATFGSCVSAAVPPGSVESFPGSAGLSDPVVATPSHSDLLFGSPLFRPPRA